MSHEWKHPSYYKELAKVRKEFEENNSNDNEENNKETDEQSN